ncbi:hypothetical protein RQP46_001114 [Phenoliferia psychrophenolica]
MLVTPSLVTFTSLLSLATSALARGHYDSKLVKALGTNNFKKTVQASEKLTLAAFHAPWCGHCVKLAPDYEKAAGNLAGLVNLVAVDCDEEKNKPLCGEMGIKGFPTLKLFPGGSAPPSDYEGPRTAKGIVEYVTGKMPTFVKRATTAKDVAELKTKALKKPIALLFTSAATVTPLYKALSTDFHKTMDFYAARDTKVGPEAMKEFGVEKVPALVVLDAHKTVIYDGALKYDAIKTFLTPYADAKGRAECKAAKAAKASSKTKDASNEWRDPSAGREGPSLPYTLLDYLLVIPYLFIGVTVALAGLIVSCAAIVFKWEPQARDETNAAYRRRPLPRRRRHLLTDSPLSSPSASPPFRATTTTMTGAPFPGSPGSSTTSAMALRAGRPRRQSVKSNRSWQASELERVSEDEGEHTSTPSREMGRRGTWAGPDASTEAMTVMSSESRESREGRELDTVPGLVLDGGSSETSSEVDTLEDADSLNARYVGLGWGSNATVLGGSGGLNIAGRAFDAPSRRNSNDSYSIPSPGQSPRLPGAIPSQLVLVDVKAKPRRFRNLNPFRSRLAPPEPSPSTSSSTPSSPSLSPLPSPASSTTNLASVGSYFNTPPGRRPR